MSLHDRLAEPVQPKSNPEGVEQQRGQMLKPRNGQRD